ncbi:MAG: restriction endonuclease subunit S [Lactobacillus paragasseri]|uniref:restriction endonuclease subunit S n=1 Tax=Lactobacillus TaxID=1578 RepID=UPI0022AC0671|nr:restriction endonuclease subunit S [Lactobacillus paragasseri]MCZ3494827.1 restriction endonuclease subunit S [Lactobacillus gasseri]MCZ3740206.1 restriction endonuclease subunit S [Lactobacillus gasseri]MCZ3743543.1 restriction endonuclease subunit S [Lactobacillus gasseri]MDU3654345.1 restriction endonuclease subunit S [Lactobacillus gasseri]MDU7064104.1 restriction endonuclease subunit S [Lactobacillus paragasseri]
MTKSDDKRVPALRFKGFTDEWEQRKLGDITKRISRKNLNLDSTLPLTISAQYGLVDQRKFFDKQIASKKLENYLLLKNGEFAYNKSYSKDYPFGAIKRLNNYKLGVLSTLYIAFKPVSINTDYLEEYFDSTKWYKEIYKRATEGARNHGLLNISPQDFFELNLSIPNNRIEQERISKILKLLSLVITLQQRKLNDLNSMKSALLQDVFPNTQGIKKIKLSTQEWNLQKISSIFKERNQRNKNGMLLSVSISKGVYPFSENDRKDNSSNDKSNYKEVKINDLAYNSMRMWQGAVGVSKYNGIVSPAYTVITPKKEENPNFYYYYFKNKRMLFNFRQHSQGLTSDTWNLKFPLFEKILIQVPSDREEEQRISSLFKQIDKSIKLSKIQIKKLTSIKQFLLQNMFI